MTAHLIRRVTILGTGLIGGSFALALRKNLLDIHVSGWDRPESLREAQARGALDEMFSGSLGVAIANADLIYIALPIAVTLDILPDIAKHAPATALRFEVVGEGPGAWRGQRAHCRTILRN